MARLGVPPAHSAVVVCPRTPQGEPLRRGPGRRRGSGGRPAGAGHGQGTLRRADLPGSLRDALT